MADGVLYALSAWLITSMADAVLSDRLTLSIDDRFPLKQSASDSADSALLLLLL